MVFYIYFIMEVIPRQSYRENYLQFAAQINK